MAFSVFQSISLSPLLPCVVCAALLFCPPATAKGRPTVTLDQLDFPVMLGGSKYKKYLKRVLRREARKVNWGAGEGSRIEYRFSVKRLSVQRKGDALIVHCTATGRLPRGRTAKSQLSFGGSPREHSKLVKRVLRIVARGVITRLAEMERVRRGTLPDARVRPRVE